MVDVVLLGELKPSQVMNEAMLYASTTGVGAAVGGIWFVVDNGVGVYNYFSNDDFKTLSDVIDDNVGTYKMYDGLY